MLGATVVNEINNSAPVPEYDYRDTIVAAQKVNWRIEDIIGGDKRLDFSKRLLPESFARTAELSFLNEDEKRVLTQIRGNTYLTIFGIVEEFIVPFVLDHVRPSLNGDDYRVRAFLQFVGEEVKHIQLFKLFSEEFKANFGSECKVIGPPEAIGEKILSHEPLSVALVILMIEWMTQAHYIDSIKDDNEIDPQFKSLLKNHWLEEAQHAKLDSRMVEALGDGLSEEQVDRAIDGFLEIGAFLDDGLQQQTLFDLEAFELATGRGLRDDEREIFVTSQHQANRWTYIGSGMVHPKFLMSLERLSPTQKARIASVAPAFC